MLKDKDIITIGKHEIVFDVSDEIGLTHLDPPKSSKAANPKFKTMALDTAAYKNIMDKNIHDPNRATLLIFRLKGKQIRKYLLEPDKQLAIGRLSDNDVVIENDAVSGHHARVFAKGNEFYVEDLNSTNGTFVHQKRIASHRLKDEDVITIGKHELVFCAYEKYTVEETSQAYAGLAYSTPSTTALDVSELKKKWLKK